MAEETFERAVEQYGDMVFRLAFGYLKNQADAEDVMQQTLLKLYTSPNTFDSPDHERFWVVRVAGLAAAIVMALCVTAGTVNAATDGKFFRRFTVVWTGEDTLAAVDGKGK